MANDNRFTNDMRNPTVPYGRRDRDTLCNTNFADCPKFNKHELNKEQIKEIVEEVYKQMKVDAFDEGKSALYKVIVFIGVTAMLVYQLITSHTFK